MNDFIVIPGTGIRLYDGYIITLAAYPGDTFIVKHGYYHNAEDTEVFGWYFISTRTSESLEVTDELFSHMMETYERNIALGMSDNEAQKDAVSRMGDEDAIAKTFKPPLVSNPQTS